MDGHVELVSGVGEFPGRENLGRGHQLGTMTDLDSGRRQIARSLIGSRRSLVLIEQVLELGPGFFEPRRIHVGEVVGNHVELRLLGLHPGGGRIKGSDHGEWSWGLFCLI